MIPVQNQCNAALIQTNTINTSFQVSRDLSIEFTQIIACPQKIRSIETHHAIRNDLIEQLWSRHGELG